MSILSQIIAYSPNKINTEVKARAMVGEPTDEQTQFGKPIYQTPEGEKVSEKSTTLFFNGDWMNVPSIQGGKVFNEDELRLMIKQGKIQPTSVHKSKDEAEAAAKDRSDSMIQEPRYMYAGGQLVSPSVDGSRPGYGKNQIKAPVKLSAKEVKNIRNGLPKGINLVSINKNWYYVLDFYAGGGFKKSKKPIRYSPIQATEKNLEYLLDEQEKLQKKYHKNRLSNEDFLKLRMNDENIQLTRSEFAKKLNKLGYKTQLDNKWTESIVNNTQKKLDLNNKWFAKGRTLKEARDVIKELAPNSKQIFERINKITDSKLKLDALRKEAQNSVRLEGRLQTWGNFSPTPSREGKLWNNFYEAVKSGDRMEIKGTFEGKSLRFKKNWPRNDKGQINWNKLDSKTKKPAWKSVKFTDTKVPDKNNPGKFKKITFTFDNLKTQVDNAFTPGHFARSTSAYAAQKELARKNIMVKGKSVNLNQYIARQNIIKKYQIDNPGKIPPEDFIQRNMRAYSPTQVHHWGEGGIGADPYRTQLTTRAANQAVAQSEATYKAALRKAGNDTVKIKAAKDNFIKAIEDISGKQGGITYTVDQKVIGDKPTEKGIRKAMLKFAGTISKKCNIDFNAEGGRIGFNKGSADCLRIAREGLEEGLKTGFKKGNQQVLAEGILKSGRFLKDAVSLRGLFGPLALGFTVAAEAGLVGYDMLSSGKSFREAVGDSVFNYALGDKTKIDSVEERDKRMVAEGMTPEQMGKIKYFESMMDDMQTGFQNYDNIKDLEKKIEDNTLNQKIDPQFFSDQAFQLNTLLDKAQADNQDYFRTNRVGALENYFTPLEDGTIPFIEGSNTLQEGLRRNELAQLRDAGVGNIYQSRLGDEKRTARKRELMLQNPDVRNYMGSYPTNYGFKEGGIASLNVNKK